MGWGRRLKAYRIRVESLRDVIELFDPSPTE
jgi:hypothetical protein